MAKVIKALSMALVIITAIAFMPLAGGQSFAASKKPATPKITTACIEGTNVEIYWSKAQRAKTYQIAIRSTGKTWVKIKTVKKSKKNKKKYTKKKKYKVVAKGNKYIVYQYKYKFSKKVTTKKRKYVYYHLKERTKYTFAVRAVNGKKASAWRTVTLKTDVKPYKNYPVVKVSTVDDAAATSVSNRLKAKKPFVIAIKAKSWNQADQLLKKLKKRAAQYNSYNIHIGNIEELAWFEEKGYYYYPMEKSMLNMFYAFEKYVKQTYAEKNQLWNADVAKYGDREVSDCFYNEIFTEGIAFASMSDVTLQPGFTVAEAYEYAYQCKQGTPYNELSLESRLLYAMPVLLFANNERKDYMDYNSDYLNGKKRSNLPEDILVSPKTFTLLCDKTAYGVCHDFTLVAQAICAHLGVDSWYCNDIEMDHAWAATKVKAASGKTKFYIIDTGFAGSIESGEAFKNSIFSDYIKGTKKAMGSNYPF